MNRKIQKQKGFSLIEIMVVLVIIGVIVAGVGGKFLGHADQSRVTQVGTDFDTIGKALSIYKLQNFKYPTSEQGLEALVERPSIDPIPRQWQDGGYLDKLPVDPWGNPYVYIVPGENGPYDLYSLGADGRSGGESYDKDLYNGRD
ncbi:MAG: type II secretion system major pseudopilin GspG [Cellvibrionaceae bacterium]